MASNHGHRQTLIHTRLSILDLSPTGAQPMANEDGSVWVVFNGELYNHHDLRMILRREDISLGTVGYGDYSSPL
jgi:asparagine synthetase B (glutamine-hydrolysing)